MNIIFLDLEGVLIFKDSPISTKKGMDFPNGLDTDAVIRLSDIQIKYDARIVVTSTWRKRVTLPEFRKAMGRAGFERPIGIIGYTPDLSAPRTKNRKEEILAWLKKNDETWPKPDKFFVGDRYVIIDDSADALDGLWHHLARTEYNSGLTEVVARRSIPALAEIHFKD